MASVFHGDHLHTQVNMVFRVSYTEATHLRKIHNHFLKKEWEFFIGINYDSFRLVFREIVVFFQIYFKSLKQDYYVYSTL